MSKLDSEITVKLQQVLSKLTPSIDPDKKFESIPAIEDDTILQKLHTSTTQHMKNSGNDLIWAQNVGLVSFIQQCIDLNVVNNPENAGIAALAIKLFGSLLSSQEIFQSFIEDKVLMDFYIIWPNLRNDPTLGSAGLDLISGLIHHDSGLSWILENGVWEKLLLPSLRSSSIFVQRKGVKVITSLLLRVVDSPQFEALVKDLLLVSDKFGEIRQHVDPTLSEEIRQSSLHVLFIFKELYLQTLGKTAIYTKLNDIGDIRGRFLSMIESQVSGTFISHVADVVTLNALHNFQEKITEYGIIEQFLVDTLCSDVIDLVKLLLQKGHMEALFRSSVNVHKYWIVLVSNMDENKQPCLKDLESLLHLVTSVQVTPICFLTRDLTKGDVCKKELFNRWQNEIHGRIYIKESLMAEVKGVQSEILSAFEKDTNVAVKMAQVSISSASSAANYLKAPCAVTIFQGLVFTLCGALECSSALVRYNSNLQKTIVDTLRVLVEKFDITWKKCVESVCMLCVLGKMIYLQNVTTQVKVSLLKAMNSCVENFIPPVMAMLVDTQEQDRNSVELMGKVMSVCLADTEWEVRDSALEVLVTCMTLAKDKYPFFVDWLLRHNLDSHLVDAIEDVEGYVRASAFVVLACVVSLDKIWDKLSTENLPHRSLASILWEGDATARKSAIDLVKALYMSGRFSEEDLNNLVVNIIQRSAEDVDDEVRLQSLEFIHVHVQESLQKSGMVDGDFPSVTFSRGKITKLDKTEVHKRVLNIITWFCESGYLNCLLLCLNDPVNTVAEKAQQIFCFLGELIKKYDVRLVNHGHTSNSYNNTNNHFTPSPTKTQPMEFSSSDSQTSSSQSKSSVPDEIRALDEIDKTISDILHSSTLDNVADIKRPLNYSIENSGVERKNIIITRSDVPLRNSAIPLQYLVQSLENIGRHKINQEDPNATQFLSLLDDILLEGCKMESTDGDDKRLRDCY